MRFARRRALTSAAICVALGALPIRTRAAECGAAITGPSRLVAETGGVRVVFAPRVWPIPVGRHFAVDFMVCMAPGSAAPDIVRLDADMPAHRHGMNYRATVKPIGEGRYRAEGLMFHMPGRWRFIFDLGTGEQAVRATREVEVE